MAPLSRARARLAAGAVAAAGLGVSTLAYLRARAAEDVPDPLGDPLTESKRYVRDLAMYGGTANVLATELRQWLAGLWHGVNLAYTLATLTAVVAGAVLWIGPRLPPRGPRAAAR